MRILSGGSLKCLMGLVLIIIHFLLYKCSFRIWSLASRKKVTLHISNKPTISLWKCLTKQQRRRVLGCCEVTSTSTKVLYVSGVWFTFVSMQSKLPFQRLGWTHFTPSTCTLIQLYPFQSGTVRSSTLYRLGNPLWHLLDPSTSTQCVLFYGMGWHQMRRRRW